LIKKLTLGLLVSLTIVFSIMTPVSAQFSFESIGEPLSGPMPLAEEPNQVLDFTLWILGIIAFVFLSVFVYKKIREGLREPKKPS
jgi:hypothetical protein